MPLSRDVRFWLSVTKRSRSREKFYKNRFRLFEAFIGHPIWRMAWGGWNITAEEHELWHEFLKEHNIKKF